MPEPQAGSRTRKRSRRSRKPWWRARAFFGLARISRLDRFPLGEKRFADQRVDQLGDGVGVGVVGAERGAGGRVEAALEEGAEDGRVDAAPVHVGGGAVQRGEVGCGRTAEYRPF